MQIRKLLYVSVYYLCRLYNINNTMNITSIYFIGYSHCCCWHRELQHASASASASS